MKYIKDLGAKTNGFTLSQIGLGGMRMGADINEGIRAIHTALDMGINFLNTGDFYENGLIEMLFKDALKTRKREDAFISVKFGGMISPDRTFYGVDMRPENIKNYLTYSLRRLGTDYVDLYQPCRLNPNIPLEETIGAITDLVKAGYVKSIGLSEVDAESLRKANSIHPISLVEVQYSLMNRHIEDEILPTARELGIGIVAFGVLMTGLIGGSSPQEKLSTFGKRMSPTSFNVINENFSKLDSLREIAEEKEMTLAQLAIGWVLAQGIDIMALVGARTSMQVNDTAKALETKLTKDDLERIERIIPKSQATCTHLGRVNLDEKGLFRFQFQ